MVGPQRKHAYNTLEAAGRPGCLQSPIAARLCEFHASSQCEHGGNGADHRGLLLKLEYVNPKAAQLKYQYP